MDSAACGLDATVTECYRQKFREADRRAGPTRASRRAIGAGSSAGVRLRGGAMRRSPVGKVSAQIQRTGWRCYRPRPRGPPVRAFL
jgi:hypothetical protein